MRVPIDYFQDFRSSFPGMAEKPLIQTFPTDFFDEAYRAVTI